MDKDTAARTINYIYGYWLPNSAYTRENGSDYELFDDNHNFTDPTLGSKYIIPIVPRPS